MLIFGDLLHPLVRKLFLHLKEAILGTNNIYELYGTGACATGH